MSSSQTMTAPAVGHHPSEAGPGVSSLYDYTRSQHSPENDHHLPSPQSTTRNDSVPEHSSSSNGLPTLSDMVAVKSKAEDQASHAFSTGQEFQSDLRRQSASALLAQLLGGQQAPNTDSDQVMEGLEVPNKQDTEQKQQFGDESNGNWETKQGEDVPPSGAEPKNGDQSQPAEPQHQTEDMAFQQSGLPFSTTEQNDNVLARTDPIDNSTDPLLFAKPNLEHSDLFPPIDFTSSGTPLEGSQQNDVVNSAYYSQNANLSALGYTEGGTHNGSGSVTGSEPRIQAFAKLEFDDGHFYCNTYSFILGRDVRAARAAHQREFQARQAMRYSRAKSSSGGNASRTPTRVKHEGSGIIGSVVSDRGGIMGFDPDVPSHMQSHISRRSSNASDGDAGGLLHATPAQLQATTDYNALAMQSLQESNGNGDAKPVDALALLPSPDACPTIPIHPPATNDGSVAGHRGISRKHVKIAYNFDKNLFEMEVLGRNGAFIGADWLSPSQIRPLHSGDYIQIGGVRIRFLLPDVPIGETGADIEEEQLAPEPQEKVESSVTVENQENAEKKDDSKATKLVPKTKVEEPARPVPSIEGDAQQPQRRRGPGRPPKDGIMSKRERAELAREQKLAARREANGGVTPPPQSKPKAGKTTATTGGLAPPVPAEGESPNSKPEKRKYTKRKKDGMMDIPLPSTEGGQFPMEHQPQEYVKPPPVKKRKPSRSPSPNYPPESAYTPEDLAKPPYNYAVLIFDALTEASSPMTLKQIYRALKLKYPYFRFKCETEGWTSSVRHNLNGNGHLFMHAERDGKGWSWQLRPGASVEKEKKRRPSPPPPPPAQPAQAPPSSVTPQYMPPPTNSYSNQPNGQSGMANPQFQNFSSMPSNPFPTSAAPPAPNPPLQHSTPYPPPAPPTASSPFPIPSPIRNNLPAAFAQTTPTTYTSPYASDPPPQLLQYQQSQQAQAQTQHMQPPPPPQHSTPYPPQNTQPLPPNNNPPQNYPSNPGLPQHQPQHQHHQPNQQQQQQQQPYNMGGQNPGPVPMDTSSDEISFNERANKAIDDFEAVLLEDYEDKDYIKGVLKSARARALGEATESSFPGGEPPDEAVLLDALKNMIKGLRGE
ncbi:hypothetical protein BDW67DRAFT_180361 [Aspergillus spinulosporus]